MARRKPADGARSRKAKKGSVAEDNARLRRALARERERRRALEQKLSVDAARQQESAAALDAGREQQAATAEMLRLISTSPSDAQPVFDAIARNAARLCGGLGAVVLRFDGTLLHLAAFHNVTPESVGRWESRYPEVPGRNTPVGRAALDGAVVHVPDLQTAAEFSAAVARQSGVRGLVAVPLLREGHAIGAIGVSRLTPGPFSDQQIALLQTFAAQAVIAIENVRLFTELAARNADLVEALEQQTATSEVLRAISGSPTDAQPVLDIIAQNATRVCGARDGAVLLKDGANLHLAAHHGPIGLLGGLGARVPIGPDWVSGRAMVERRAIQVEDLLAAGGDYPRGLEMARHNGHRTTLVTPLLHEGEPIGVLLIRRGEVRLFTPKQMSLLETFANQAVIAIENVRLFNELAARNKDLTESLERQTATAEILRVISGSPTDLAPVLDAIAASAVRVCGAYDALVYLREGDLIRRVAHHGPVPVLTQEVTALTRTRAMGATILDRRVVHLVDAQVDGEFPEVQEIARTHGFRTTLGVPLLREGEAIGAVFIRRQEVQSFTDTQVSLLQTFADQAVIAIENVRLFKELAARNTDLSESLERQTATAEILRVISQAQTDVQPVFEAIADSAMRLFGAWSTLVFRYDGEFLRLAAARGGLPGSSEPLMARQQAPERPTADYPPGRAVLTRTVQHVVDVATSDLSWTPRFRENAIARGFRSVVVVPMSRGDDVVGVITVSRDRVGGFEPAEIALVQTFADQAVIAIENARLLTELQARTADLTRSVEQLTALGEVGRAVSSSVELPTVLRTIVTRAAQLAGTDGGAIYEYDEAAEEFQLRATLVESGELDTARREGRLRKGEGAIGRLAETREPIQVPDLTVEGAYQGRLREALIRTGVRSLLAVPIIREDRILGGLVLNRRAAGEFGPAVVEVLKTFATQSALAIHNARLFRELADKSRQLEVANRHKSEFLASMSHELRTPLNAIIGYSEMLQEEAQDLQQDALVPDLRKINAAGKHLLELINAVLDLSKIEAGRMDLYLETFSVPALVAEIVAVVQPLADKNGNRLETVCAAEVGEMRADLTKVRQALFNLLSNACKFTERGTVTLSARQEPGPDRSEPWMLFEVADTGIGLTQEQMGRLFEEFSQAEAATSRRYGGTGLGLALSRRLCRLMGGEVTVTSESGRGSTFTVRLPREVAEPLPEQEAAPGAAATGRDGAKEPA